VRELRGIPLRIRDLRKFDGTLPRASELDPDKVKRPSARRVHRCRRHPPFPPSPELCQGVRTPTAIDHQRDCRPGIGGRHLQSAAIPSARSALRCPRDHSVQGRR
jgi:hypothetical protein